MNNKYLGKSFLQIVEPEFGESAVDASKHEEPEVKTQKSKDDGNEGVQKLFKIAEGETNTRFFEDLVEQAMEKQDNDGRRVTIRQMQTVLDDLSEKYKPASSTLVNKALSTGPSQAPKIIRQNLECPDPNFHDLHVVHHHSEPLTTTQISANEQAHRRFSR